MSAPDRRRSRNDTRGALRALARAISRQATELKRLADLIERRGPNLTEPEKLRPVDGTYFQQRSDALHKRP